MHYISCKLCGKDETKVVLEQPNAKCFPRTIVRCLNCGLGYVNPQPDLEELKRLYQEHHCMDVSSSPLGESCSEKIPYSLSVNERVPRRLSLLKKMKKPGRLLDVGCGTGEFLYYAKADGWEGIGVDISSFAAEQAREKTKLWIQEGTIADFPKEMGSFDLITMWEVTEHMPDPVTDVKIAWDLLKQNGLIAISTPNLGSLRYRLYKERWRGFTDDPKHIFFFDARTLIGLLTKCGFKIKKVLTRKISPVLWRWLVYFGLGNELEIYAQK